MDAVAQRSQFNVAASRVLLGKRNGNDAELALSRAQCYNANPALQLLYFQYEFLLEEQSHWKKFTKPAQNAGASKSREKKEIPFCLWKSLQSIENKQSLEEQTQANPLFKPAVFV